jgi:hypothetical protein
MVELEAWENTMLQFDYFRSTVTVRMGTTHATGRRLPHLYGWGLTTLMLMEIVVCIQTQAWCNIFSGTLHGSVLSIGTDVDRSAELVATRFQ